MYGHWKRAALLLLLLLAGCSTGGAQYVDDTVAMLNALNQGDAEGAAAYLCEEEAERTIEGLATIGPEDRQTWAFQNLQCSPQGQDVRCTYSTVVMMDENTQEVQLCEVKLNKGKGAVCGVLAAPGRKVCKLHAFLAGRSPWVRDFVLSIESTGVAEKATATGMEPRHDPLAVMACLTPTAEPAKTADPKLIASLIPVENPAKARARERRAIRKARKVAEMKGRR